MRNLGDHAAAITNANLADEAAVLLVKTSVDINKLTPHVTDGAELQELIDIINEATDKNENNAQLLKRLEKARNLSESVISKVIEIVNKAL